MPKFITINGTNAWISERDTIAEARQSAINICDHSEEVIVRLVTHFVDHTRVYLEQS